jgi:hypothetical protein
MSVSMTAAVVVCRHHAALGAGAVAAPPIHPDFPPPLVSDRGQVAACGTGLHLLDLGRGEYAVSATPPAGDDGTWAPVPTGAVILIDPCGVTTIPHPTPLEPAR